MKYAFTAHSHPNILATHRTTLEITKDTELTIRGECVVAVGADFSLQRLKQVISSCGNDGKIKLTIAAAGVKEEMAAVVNKGFNSNSEIVFRKGGFFSERTLGVNADKAAADLGRKLVGKLKSNDAAISITIEAVNH